MKKALPPIEVIYLDDIEVCDGRRPIDDGAVTALAASMEKIGLKIPISARLIVGDSTGSKGLDGKEIHQIFYQLIAGAHRLAAAKKLGWNFIDAFVSRDESDDQVRLWEIAENLHRAELTAQERAGHIAEWVRITDQSAQIAPNESKRTDGRGHRPESGINKASRELGLDRTDVQRAIKIADLTPEAKKVALEVGLGGNASALLAAKDKSGDATKEIANLRADRARRDAEKQRKDAERAAAKIVREGKSATAYRPGNARHTLADIEAFSEAFLEALSDIAPGAFDLKVLSPPSERANFKETILAKPFSETAKKYFAPQEAKLGPIGAGESNAALPIDLDEVKGGIATLRTLELRLGRYVMTDFDDALALAKRALEKRLAA